jgi:hypothetical protein
MRANFDIEQFENEAAHGCLEMVGADNAHSAVEEGCRREQPWVPSPYALQVVHRTGCKDVVAQV